MTRLPGGEIAYGDILSEVGRALKPNEIRKLTKLLGRSDIISLAAGAPSTETFPIEELADLASRVLRTSGPQALQYGPTRGQRTLLESVLDLLHRRGITSSLEQLVVTTGSQQGLDLAARVLIDPGDVAMVELPSYIGGTIALRNSRADLIGVRQDDSGLDVDDLEQKILSARGEGRRVKCVYTIPNFHNPSGITLAADRRQRLVELADEFNLIIIEDDPYFELYFGTSDTQLKPIAALRPERVIYLSSFSKVLAPGIRCAYLSAPPELASKIELAKEGIDLSSSLLDQAIVDAAVREGLIDRRLPEIRQFYKIRCNAMLEALDRLAPRLWRWTRPGGGFFVLVTASPEVDANRALPIAIERGVAFVPGKPFFADGSGSNTLRLAFSKESPERIGEGVKLLLNVLAEQFPA
jgi:2-aminoadipate transaminase